VLLFEQVIFAMSRIWRARAKVVATVQAWSVLISCLQIKTLYFTLLPTSTIGHALLMTTIFSIQSMW
jgi:hypothetical protein